MNILALDIATKTGWASYVDGVTESGVWQLPTEKVELGRACCILEDRISEIIGATQFDLMFLEQPSGFGSNAGRLLGLFATALRTAYRYGAEERPITANAWRKVILGRAPRRSEAKRLVMVWARDNGFNPVDDNEADALALLAYALEIEPARVMV